MSIIQHLKNEEEAEPRNNSTPLTPQFSINPKWDGEGNIQVPITEQSQVKTEKVTSLLRTEQKKPCNLEEHRSTPKSNTSKRTNRWTDFFNFRQRNNQKQAEIEQVDNKNNNLVIFYYKMFNVHRFIIHYKIKYQSKRLLCLQPSCEFINECNLSIISTKIYFARYESLYQKL